ncbi:hypothetical protein [Micromonospora sp. NPDC005189]|uniref:hypothetical protein n=1 Tax=unclassified Micromonospora TaxID=2617518 RepID=UPI0033AB903C
MKFMLTYEGPLASNGRPSQKHDIRLTLHPQLRELWQHKPLAQFYDMGGPNVSTVGGYDFCSVVHPRWHFRAHLEILMLRPEAPGGVVKPRGDIDNRLKTLFDALTRPTQPQDIPSGWAPGDDQKPLHCLLDDDSLITGFTVRTDRLLAAPTQSHMKLVIGVEVDNTAAFGGLAVLG